MPKFRVTYEHDITITYDALVEADTAEEACQKMEDGDFISEEETDYQGLTIRIQDVEEVE